MNSAADSAVDGSVNRAADNTANDSVMGQPELLEAARLQLTELALVPSPYDGCSTPRGLSATAIQEGEGVSAPPAHRRGGEGEGRNDSQPESTKHIDRHWLLMMLPMAL